VAVASAGPYASLHIAPDKKPCQHPTTQFFTGRMPFLPPNQQRQCTEGIIQNALYNIAHNTAIINFWNESSVKENAGLHPKSCVRRHVQDVDSFVHLFLDNVGSEETKVFCQK